MPALDRLSLMSRGRVWPDTWLRPDHDRTSPAHTTATVMVVDDDEKVRRIASRMLRDEGYRVLEAPSAEHALEQLAQAAEVQIVLADIAMPGGMNGVELAEKIHAEEPSRRVVLMSGYNRLFPQWGEIGARFPLLIKPFTAEQLIRQMDEVMKGGMH